MVIETNFPPSFQNREQLHLSISIVSFSKKKSALSESLIVSLFEMEKVKIKLQAAVFVISVFLKCIILCYPDSIFFPYLMNSVFLKIKYYHTLLWFYLINLLYLKSTPAAIGSHVSSLKFKFHLIPEACIFLSSIKKVWERIGGKMTT